MKTSILALPMVARWRAIEGLLGSAPAQLRLMSARHDFVFAAPHPDHEGFTQQYF
jgi:hypothetical protein